MAHETIVPNAQITINGEKLTVKIDHMLDIADDEHQYTDCYRVTIGKYKVVNIEMGEDGFWIESETRQETDLASEVGKLIESYSE